MEGNCESLKYLSLFLSPPDIPRLSGSPTRFFKQNIKQITKYSPGRDAYVANGEEAERSKDFVNFSLFFILTQLFC